MIIKHFFIIYFFEFITMEKSQNECRSRSLSAENANPKKLVPKHRAVSNSPRGNVFKRMLSFVTRKDNSSTDSSDAIDGENVIFRWTAACINANCPMFSKNPQYNTVYCPLSSLLMFIVVWFSSDGQVTKQMLKMFELSESDIEELGTSYSKLEKLSSKKVLYFFVRFLVDEEKNTTVSKELMNKCRVVAKTNVFFSIRPSKALRFISTLCYSDPPQTVPRPSLLTTNAYGSIGIFASWNGKAKTIGRERFAQSYGKRIYGKFFEIRTKFRRSISESFEIFEIPFYARNDAKTPGSFVIFRPLMIGALPYVNRSLKSEYFVKVMDELSNERYHEGNILLPEMNVNSCNDLWKNLVRRGIPTDLGRSHKCPPIASIWHWANLSINQNGISSSCEGKLKKVSNSEKPMQQRISSELLFKKSTPYAARIDSPFTYMIMLNGIPLFTGSYFGTPNPKPTEIFINAPERIRKQKIKVFKKKPKKITRRQKLFKKIRKSDEADKKKIRKLREKNSKSKTKSSATGSAETDKKSRNSKGWRRIFGK